MIELDIVEAALPEMETLAKEFSDRAFESTGGCSQLGMAVLVYALCNGLDEIRKKEDCELTSACLALINTSVNQVLAGMWHDGSA